MVLPLKGYPTIFRTENLNIFPKLDILVHFLGHTPVMDGYSVRMLQELLFFHNDFFGIVKHYILDKKPFRYDNTCMHE